MTTVLKSNRVLLDCCLGHTTVILSFLETPHDASCVHIYSVCVFVCVHESCDSPSDITVCDITDGMCKKMSEVLVLFTCSLFLVVFVSLLR